MILERPVTETTKGTKAQGWGKPKKEVDTLLADNMNATKRTEPTLTWPIRQLMKNGVQDDDLQKG